MSAPAPAQVKKQFSDGIHHDWDRTAPKKRAKVERDWQKRRDGYLIDAGRAEEIVKPVPSAKVLDSSTPRPVSSTSFCTTVEMFWHTRPCWMCGDAGPCGHREYEVALAYVEASQKGIRR